MRKKIWVVGRNHCAKSLFVAFYKLTKGKAFMFKSVEEMMKFLSYPNRALTPDYVVLTEPRQFTNKAVVELEKHNIAAVVVALKSRDLDHVPKDFSGSVFKASCYRNVAGIRADIRLSMAKVGV